MKHDLALGALILTLLASASMAQDPYGAGTPGAGGIVPTLTCGQPWLGNSAFDLTIGSGLGGAIAWLGISAQPASISAGPVQILISPLPLDLVLLLPLALSGPAGVPGAGYGQVPIPLYPPPPPAAAGLVFYGQAVVVEGPGGAVSATRGLRIELVMPPMVFAAGFGQASFVDPLVSSIVAQTNAGFVTDAEFAHAGRRLYAATGAPGVLEADMDVAPPAWSTLWAAGTACYGIAVDDARDIAYTLAGFTGTQELVALDVRLGSTTYGQVLGATSGFGASQGYLERWELSPDGTVAAVLSVLSPRLFFVDTDPAGPGWMQYTVVGPVPSGPSQLSIATSAGFTPDGRQLLVSVQLAGSSPGEIARYDRITGAWMDHDPGAYWIQNIGPFSSPPAQVPVAPWTLDVARSGDFAVVSGWAFGGGLGRLDLDPLNPLGWSFTRLFPSVRLDNAWACALSPDDAVVAVATFAPAPAQVVFLDPLTGAYLTATGITGATSIDVLAYR